MKLLIRLSFLVGILTLTSIQTFADEPTCEELTNVKLECKSILESSPYNVNVVIYNDVLKITENTFLSTKKPVRSGEASCTSERTQVGGIIYNLAVSMSTRGKNYTVRLAREDESPAVSGYRGLLEVEGTSSYATLECN